jgi:hypothetical protein
MTVAQSASRGAPMAIDGKLAIFGTAIAAWRDAFKAIGAMPGMAGIAFVILLAISLGSFLIFPNPFDLVGNPLLPLVGILSSIISSIFLAPLAIAVHRYVLLGEVTNGYRLEPSSPRYQRFVGFAILVNLLWSVPTTMQGLLPDSKAEPLISGVGGLIALVLFIAIIIMLVRRAILFPAIAVDAPGAGWRNAGQDTKGHSWRVAFIYLCVALPSLLLIIPIYYLYMTSGAQGMTGRIVYSVVTSIIQVPTLCAFAAAASHIYRAYANNLARPAGTAGPSVAAA